MVSGGKRGIRIIAGQWRRSRLEVLQRPGLRPTPDRVRETLFNWLMPIIHGARCLDLFAGTGALGFEAASRGAGEVVMVERDTAVHAQLDANVRRLGADGVTTVHADAVTWMQRQHGLFDVIFLDPPFRTHDPLELCRMLLLHGLVGPESKVYLERDAASCAQQPVPTGWRILNSGQAARVRYDLVAPERSSTESATIGQQ